METIESNKLIAQFMGDQVFVINHEAYTEYCIRTERGVMKRKEFMFHQSWDWLMPVVERIERLDNGIYQVDILQEGCRVLTRTKHFATPIDCTVGKLPVGTTKLEATYKAVVAFIKWYNENN